MLPSISSLSPRLLRLAAQPAENLQREDTDAAAGRLFAAGDAVILDRLASDDAWVKAVVLIVLAHDPGHRLGVGSHVGRWDVDVGADDVMNLIDELAGDPLLLGETKGARVDGDPPLGAAVGNVHHRGLQRHQRREAADFVEVDLGVITEAPLHWSAGVVVLHPIADVGGDLALISLE